MQQFNSDIEIKEYIEKSIESIKLLNECRLYREEQLQITEEVMRVRNSTEWIIRINKVIKNGCILRDLWLRGNCWICIKSKSKNKN